MSLARYALRWLLSLILPFGLCLSPLSIAAPQSYVIKHYQDHPRYHFGLSVLELVLSKAEIDYQLISPQLGLNEGRGEQLVKMGALDLQFMSTTVEREQSMIPIRIPIYRGLLGARLLLVERDNKELFSDVQDAEGLKAFVGGHGVHWGDLPVYAANGLPVKTSASYDSLFRMLKGNRFDYFHRGVSEVWGEIALHGPHLTIADHVFLFYPHPVYFFVNKDKPVLADLIEKGFAIALKDGSYQYLFEEAFGAMVRQAKLEQRRLIVLDNPVNPNCMQVIDTHWWLPVRFQTQIELAARDSRCSQ